PLNAPSQKRSIEPKAATTAVASAAVASIRFAPSHPAIGLARVTDTPPTTHLPCGDRGASDKIEHPALRFRGKLPLFAAINDDPRGLGKVAAVLVAYLALNIGTAADLTLFVLEDRIAEIVVADHEGSGVPAAILVQRGKIPPDHMHLVIHDQVFLEVDRAALGHPGLIKGNDPLDRPAFADTSDVVKLRYVESSPILAGQIPLHTIADQRTGHLEQALFFPAEKLARGA